MKPSTEREIEERIAWAKRERSDPWRVLRAIEAGIPICMIEADTFWLGELIAELEAMRCGQEARCDERRTA